LHRRSSAPADRRSGPGPTHVGPGAVSANRLLHLITQTGKEMRDQPQLSARDRGDTLIEIVLTVVITAITVTALVSGLATAGTAGQAQRNSVSTDTVMRNYAEATKAAARGCTDGAAFVVPFAAAGFTVATTPAGVLCPPPISTQQLELSVTGPNGVKHVMSIKIRTP
jgi:type II secretory pathway pseudopilin PulG